MDNVAGDADFLRQRAALAPEFGLRERFECQSSPQDQTVPAFSRLSQLNQMKGMVYGDRRH